MPLPIKDLAGQRFGRLTAISLCERFSDGKTAWLCNCDCGEHKRVRATALMRGYTLSCGCLRKEGPHTTHGQSKTRLYRIWRNIKTRCQNPKATKYSRYGQRGISICKEWENNFPAFGKWAIDSGYLDTLSIDRINNNGNYEPENCRWSTQEEQSQNRCDNVYLILDGKKISAHEAAVRLVMSPYTLYSRLNKLNWSEEDAMSTVPDYANGAKRSRRKC